MLGTRVRAVLLVGLLSSSTMALAQSAERPSLRAVRLSAEATAPTIDNHAGTSPTRDFLLACSC